MLLRTSVFAIFFVIVFSIGWMLNDGRIGWKWFMLVASYVFYGYWNPKFVLLIVASTVGNDAIAFAISAPSTALATNKMQSDL